MAAPFVSRYCVGERCTMCGEKTPATHKVEEVIFDDDPIYARHPLVAYICTEHFNKLMVRGHNANPTHSG